MKTKVVVKMKKNLESQNGKKKSTDELFTQAVDEYS